ncbi:hypothetical protein EKE94_13140 [Mesobaculum littorinae]|uniref:Uncharacterized protein n=1 Tax=Mesobaculum littorinae TaxID=2486419 RepID=A0A438AFI3_9RHOB|nr:hypothetical protein [Mesobaculum littorinae]RVV97483.1 hypothetical protein EKE94_13140 [Mesobaculum littorinae]
MFTFLALLGRRPPVASTPPDPLDHPDLRGMRPDQLADLPVPRHPTPPHPTPTSETPQPQAVPSSTHAPAPRAGCAYPSAPRA